MAGAALVRDPTAVPCATRRRWPEIPHELLTSTLPYYGRLVSGLSILLLFPFFTTMFSLWKKETHRLRMTNLTAWILAFILTLSLFILQINRQAIQLWGLWLYILTTISAIIFEFGVQRWELSREHKA
jgi:hypothetical protein